MSALGTVSEPLSSVADECPRCDETALIEVRPGLLGLIVTRWHQELDGLVQVECAGCGWEGTAAA